MLPDYKYGRAGLSMSICNAENGKAKADYKSLY